jgi:hypothetical protein
MKRSFHPRKTVILSEPVHKQLNMYALVASAAGVGMLAAAQPSEAKVVYTKAHAIIGYGGVWTYRLDLNHDGISDFYFYDPFGSDGVALFVKSGADGRSIQSTSMGFAAALPAGVRIGPKRASRKTPKGGDDMAFYTCRGFPTGCFGGGPWHNVHNRYLGLKFLIHGKPHYGWARLNLNVNGMKLSATLTGYAYETIPNKAIITGKTKGPDEEPAANETPDASVTAPTHAPATLGALALGAPGLSIWRRVELADAPR